MLTNLSLVHQVTRSGMNISDCFLVLQKLSSVWFAFVLWCRYYAMYFQSSVGHHLVFTLVKVKQEFLLPPMNKFRLENTGNCESSRAEYWFNGCYPQNNGSNHHFQHTFTLQRKTSTF